ncbi:MAG: DNA internalization-related competence protein ComEC/Rec2, partial [Gammaproteobacteria bacterium]
MRIGSVLFLSGILTLVQFHELPSLFMVGLVPLFGALNIRSRLFRPALWYVTGFVWVLLVSHNILTQELAADLEGEEISVHGRVVSLPAISDLHIQFDFDISSVTDKDGNPRASPGKVRLNWYRPYKNVLPGEEYELVVKLKRPRGYMNPGGFDYEAWLFQQRIRASGYVRDDITVQGRYQRQFSFHSVRYYLREKLDRALPDSLVAKLVPALTLGDRSNMDNNHWRVLAATGTSHLLAISGLHIGLIAGFVFFLSRWFWALWPAGTNLIPAPRLAAGMSLLAAVFYALLAGFTIPTQRALVMIGIVILLNFMGRRIAGSYVFALALLGVLVYDPLAVLSPGFWLSFTAVLLILLALNSSSCSAGSTSAYKRIHQWGRVQVYIYIGLMPLLVIWFNQLPLLSLLANSIAIPWVSLVCIPLIILAVPVLLIHEPAGEFILGIGSNALGILWYLLEYLATTDNALMYLPDSSWIVLIASLSGIALLFLPAGLPGKWLGMICLLPLFLPWKDLPAKGEFDLTVLDVGQGLAVTVETQGHLLLYDTGPGFSSGFNAGWAI